ncbi:MAG: divalent-cation tolerance protein CutA [Candidatus Omnitrophota bacterium]
MPEYIVVFVTCSSREEGQKIAFGLLNKKLAACVNIIDGLASFFTWQGKLDSANESLLVIKTKANLFNELKKEVKAMHSYDIPEIIGLPIIVGEEKYLRWLDESCR